MNSLREDLEEVGEDQKLRAWVARKRREAFIASDEAACWFVYREGGVEEQPYSEWLGRSPGDALATAEGIAGEAPLRGVGRWLMERYEDGEGTMPSYLVVRPRPDEQQP